MPSVFCHAVAALALARYAPTGVYGPRLAIGCMLSAAVPDLDALGHACGIPYDSLFGHRGITHSVAFAAVWSVLIGHILSKPRDRPWYMGLLFLSTCSHPLLDMCTNGGLGCALWAPFRTERMFFPWRPIEVSPLSVVRFFAADGWRVVRSEALWIGCPSMAVFLLAWSLRKRPQRKATTFAP